MTRNYKGQVLNWSPNLFVMAWFPACQPGPIQTKLILAVLFRQKSNSSLEGKT